MTFGHFEHPEIKLTYVRLTAPRIPTTGGGVAQWVRHPIPVLIAHVCPVPSEGKVWTVGSVVDIMSSAGLHVFLNAIACHYICVKRFVNQKALYKLPLLLLLLLHSK